MKDLRPHVVHVIDELPPDGAERLIVDVLQNRSDAFRYSVLCIVTGGTLVEELRSIGVPVTVLGRRAGFDPGTVPVLRRWYRDNEVAVVHTHLYAADTYGRLAAWLGRVPAIFSTRHSAKAWNGVSRRALAWAMSLLSTRIIACGAGVGQFMRDHEHIAADRIVVIPNGIDLRRFKSADAAAFRRELALAPESILVGAVGRLLPVKGHADLIESLAAMVRAGHDCHGVIVGTGELEMSLKDLCRKLHVEDRIHFTGQRSDIPNIVAAFDIFVMASLWEGLPMALLEAMALGRPVIATAVGSVPEVIVDGTTGRLIPPGNRAALTAALAELLSNRPSRLALGAAARALVDRHFDAALTARAYENLYRHALQGSPAWAL